MTAKPTDDRGHRAALDLVDIVREFMSAHRIKSRLFERYRRGELPFEDLEEFVGDDEASVLYRLKERSHGLFRPRDSESRAILRREALFDLAVGSLFHEATKFRESFYQQQVYGPRVRALRSTSNDGDDEFFEEFEKILAVVTERLEEGLQETEILVDQAGSQLRLLLAEHPRADFALRYLLENRELAEEVFGRSVDELLREIQGDAAAAFERVGRSYLDSGFYQRAAAAFRESMDRGGDSRTLEPLVDYALGMTAYLVRDYGESVTRLERWCERAHEHDPALVEMARSAVSKVDQLVDGVDSTRIAAAATALAERLGATVPGAAAS